MVLPKNMTMESWAWEKFDLVMFLDIGLLTFNPIFLSPTWSKLKNCRFQCSSERALPEVFKTHPTFVPTAFFGGVMTSQTWERFSWTP